MFSLSFSFSLALFDMLYMKSILPLEILLLCLLCRFESLSTISDLFPHIQIRLKITPAMFKFHLLLQVYLDIILCIIFNSF